ncbi:hypothetical protein G6F23_013631 [Rhizopus arrhizus]|nr:hypothetical protein G6F23_013631 [Rhizopus arrhizus]
MRLLTPRAYVPSLACGNAEPLAAFAQRLRHRRERHGETFFASVGFGDRYFQSAAAGVGVQIVDGERTRRHRGLVQHRAVLADGDARIALCHAAHDRRIAAQRIGQHAFIGSDAHAGEADTVEQLSTGIGLAQRELAVPARQVALQGTVERGEVRALRAVAERTAVAQPPCAQVHPSGDARVAVLLALVTVVVDVVAEERSSDALVAQLRGDEATRLALQCHLRQ